MATWSSRRKSIIGSIVLVIILAVIAAIYFSFFYRKPTCFDGVQNGGELGIDCGGSCQKLCQSAFLESKIIWGGGKFEVVAPHLYNVAALIANPNNNVAAVNIPYKFTLYDSRGLLITERTGKINLPAHRNVLAFEPAVDVGARTLEKVTFEFTTPPEWFTSTDTLGSLSIGDKKYDEEENSSSLEVLLKNQGLTPIENMTIGAVLSDGNGNAIGFSQTKLDELTSGSENIAPFTWPFTRQGKVVTIDVYPSVVPPHK